MDGVVEVLRVAGVFILQIGVPVSLLVALGILIDRRHAAHHHTDQTGTPPAEQTVLDEPRAQ